MKLLSLLPLLVVVSLVYAATRYEDWPSIRAAALRTFLGFASLLGIVFVLLLVLHVWIL